MLASPTASPASKSMPVSPCATSSGLPPTRDATTQQPQAMASIRELESASENDGKTKMSMACSQSATRDVAGSKTQADMTPSSRARSCNLLSEGPLPTTASLAPGGRWPAAANASSKTSSPFSGLSAQTTPITRLASRNTSGRGLEAWPEQVRVDAVIAKPYHSVRHFFFIAQAAAQELAIHNYGIHHVIRNPHGMALRRRPERPVDTLARNHRRTTDQAGRRYAIAIGGRVERVHQPNPLFPHIRADTQSASQAHHGGNREMHNRHAGRSQIVGAQASRAEAADPWIEL